MREIKFRGKRVDNGHWIEGDILHNAYDAFHNQLPFSIKREGYYPIEVIPETAGQFTGLTDINEKEIYEGDICELYIDGEKIGANEIIDFKHGAFWLRRRNYPIYNWLQYETRDLGVIYGEIKVIGNIHNNPELFK